MKPDCDSPVDFSVWFMPQRLTTLHFTPIYATLTDAQRLRYNQLHALYLNEQTMFFERALAPSVLGYFLAREMPPGLNGALHEFAADEERHTEMFRQLNRRCAPEIYAANDFHFIRVSPAARRILRLIASRPRLFPLVLWLMHLQEERALDFGKQFVQCEHALEPHFLHAQRIHFADEVSHISCDKRLLDLVWPRTNRFVRFMNIRLLAWLMQEFFGAPKRSQLNVVSALAGDFPELGARLPEIHRALFNLRHDHNFLRSMYSRENVPDVFRRFDASPEFRPLARVLPGYQPNYAS